MGNSGYYPTSQLLQTNKQKTERKKKRVKTLTGIHPPGVPKKKAKKKGGKGKEDEKLQRCKCPLYAYKKKNPVSRGKQRKGKRGE